MTGIQQKQAMTDKWWNEQFELQGKSPEFWWLQARRLKRGADLNWLAYEKAVEHHNNDPDSFFAEERKDGLNVDIELCKVYYFLLGLSIENLVKGILIGRDANYFSGKKKMTHEIKDYVAECGIYFDTKKEKLLKDLSVVVRWKGRYPTPIRLEYWSLKKTSEGHNTLPGSISPNDKNELEEIYQTLNNTLYSENISE